MDLEQELLAIERPLSTNDATTGAKVDRCFNRSRWGFAPRAGAGGRWIWQGEHARCTGIFIDGGQTLIARHELSDDGVNWKPSMNVTLRKVD